MWIPGKLSCAFFIFSVMIAHEAFCRQANDCIGIMRRNDKSTAFIQQDFSDSSVSGSVRIELVAQNNRPLSLTLYVEDYEYPVSEKDSLGLLNYRSPYELRDGMDVLFQFPGKNSRTFDGKQTLKNLEPVYRQQLEADLIFTCRYPPPVYPKHINRKFILMYNIPLDEKDIHLFRTKNLQDIIIKNSKIHFSISGSTAALLRNSINCMMPRQPGQ